ncbi:MAG: hypothetical protein KC561_15295 [Myxococcales bacterium]|nr:hypothetical protein [Myxococcales bacterium]
MTVTLEQLAEMNSAALFDVMRNGAPLDLHALADTSYTGIDLSMPALFHRLFWRTFRKTFHRDPALDVIRGWNVKVDQADDSKVPRPLRNRQGRPKTFGHYEVRSAHGVAFPRGWQGSHYLDYRVAGNRFLDVPARWGYCPLVAVNAGDPSLLLGWEVFRVGPLSVPIRDFWALRLEGPLEPDDVVARPVPPRGLVREGENSAS